MGRTLKRVPLDFSWPLHKVWDGYRNPHHRDCPDAGKTCFNGMTAAGQWLQSICRFLGLVAEQAAEAPTAEDREHFRRHGRIYPHPYLQEFAQAPRTEAPPEVHAEAWRLYPGTGEDEEARKRDGDNRMRHYWEYVRRNPPQLLPLDADLLQLLTGLSKAKLDPKRPLFGFGQDVEYGLWKRFIKLSGLPKGWGICPTCDGDRLDPAVREAYDAWTEEEPPAGPGYQVWETVSEGSPVTPVFADPEDLVSYLVTRQNYSREGARAFLKVGDVPSLVVTEDGRQLPDIESAVLQQP